MYVAGGNVQGNPTPNVFAAPILDGGDVGAFSQTTSLEVGIGVTGATLASYNSHLYLEGGAGPSGRATNGVEVAESYPDGGLSAWVSSPNFFTAARFTPGVVASGNELYVLTGDADTDVQAAPILPDGSLGAFRVVGYYSTSRSNAAVTIYDHRLYLVAGGGMGSTGALTDVQSACVP
jgi:hypothetical protein